MMADTLVKRQSDACPVQDGGALGWFAVLGSFGGSFAWVGSTKGLAVLLPTLQDQLSSPTWLVGWMIAIIDGIIDLAGITQ